VIGDVHGHFDRLQALLDKAGVTSSDEVIQLGDLGHFGFDTQQGDAECFASALDLKRPDIVLWGNHDRAVIEPLLHAFRGFRPPHTLVVKSMRELEANGRLVVAAARHGYLLTHAGLHPEYFDADKTPDPESQAALLNKLASDTFGGDNEVYPAVHGIHHDRGGRDAAGGILWRDYGEPLAPIPQILRTYLPPKHNPATGRVVVY